MSNQALDTVRASVQKQIDEAKVTGAVTAVARHNKLVYFEAQGTRNTTTGEAMRRDDLFRMMSSTKPVTAVAVLMMQDEGKLSIDDPVSRFIPSFKNQKVAVAAPGTTDASQVQLVPAQRDITIKDLLTHTSGLSSASMGGMTMVGALVNKIERRPDDTLASIVDRLGGAALDFQPGSRWGYSPLDGFDVLMRIVEITSKQDAERFMRERLFEPLGMQDSFFNVPTAQRNRIVPLYQRSDNRWVEQASIFGDGPYKRVSGAGNLFSTAHDYLMFELMLLNNGSLNGRRILKADSVALMRKDHVGSRFTDLIPAWTAGLAFGLGVAVTIDRSNQFARGLGAMGWGGAYGTTSWSDPELDIAAVCLVQHAGANLAKEVAAPLRDAIRA